MSQTFGHPEAALPAADSLHIRLCDGIQHMEWPQAGLTADFLGVFFADIAAAQGADSRSARHAIGYLVNELLENAIKFRVPGGDPVLVAGGVDEAGFAFEMHNEATVEVAAHFGTLLEELTSRDPGDLMIERIEANAENSSSGGSGLGILTLMNDYSAEKGWTFGDKGAGGTLDITTRVRLPHD